MNAFFNRFDGKPLWEKLARWLIFGVIIALLPLAFNGLSQLGRSGTIDWAKIFSRGELLIVTAGICAAAIGELVGRGTTKLGIFKIISGGGCMVVLFLASLWFADISNSVSVGTAINAGVVSKGSIVMFLMAVLSSGSCIALAEA